MTTQREPPDPVMVAVAAEGGRVFHPDGARYYPHYYSTYCVHGLHRDCRLTCKTCDGACRCPCHGDEPHETAGE